MGGTPIPADGLEVVDSEGDKIAIYGRGTVYDLHGGEIEDGEDFGDIEVGGFFMMNTKGDIDIYGETSGDNGAVILDDVDSHGGSFKFDNLGYLKAGQVRGEFNVEARRLGRVQVDNSEDLRIDAKERTGSIFSRDGLGGKIDSPHVGSVRALGKISDLEIKGNIGFMYGESINNVEGEGRVNTLIGQNIEAWNSEGGLEGNVAIATLGDVNGSVFDDYNFVRASGDFNNNEVNSRVLFVGGNLRESSVESNVNSTIMGNAEDLSIDSEYLVVKGSLRDSDLRGLRRVVVGKASNNSIDSDILVSRGNIEGLEGRVDRLIAHGKKVANTSLHTVEKGTFMAGDVDNVEMEGDYNFVRANSIEGLNASESSLDVFIARDVMDSNVGEIRYFGNVDRMNDFSIGHVGVLNGRIIENSNIGDVDRLIVSDRLENSVVGGEDGQIEMVYARKINSSTLYAREINNVVAGGTENTDLVAKDNLDSVLIYINAKDTNIIGGRDLGRDKVVSGDDSWTTNGSNIGVVKVANPHNVAFVSGVQSLDNDYGNGDEISPQGKGKMGRVFVWGESSGTNYSGAGESSFSFFNSGKYIITDESSYKEGSWLAEIAPEEEGPGPTPGDPGNIFF